MRFVTWNNFGGQGLSDKCGVCRFTKGRHYHGEAGVLLCPRRPLVNGVVSLEMTEYVRATRTAWDHLLNGALWS